jgi:Ca2+-transporting ATPase
MTSSFTPGPADSTDRVTIVHDRVPGRTRLAVRGLRRNADLVAAIEAQVRQRGGVTAVAADPRTGRVLVRHGARIDAQTVAGWVAAIVSGGPGVETHRPVRPDPAPDVMPAVRPTLHPPAATIAYHALPLESVLEQLDADRDAGMKEAEAQRRLAVHGPNRLTEARARSAFDTFFSQFKSLPVALLGGSAVLSVATRAFFDAAVTLGVVLVNATIGFVTESGAQRAIRSMTRAEELEARVVRDGVERCIPASKLVPGDLLTMRRGDPVPADARLLESYGLTVDESALTGESLPRHKEATVPLRVTTPLADRTNMLFLGTTVVGGSARAIVVATGDRTEIGLVQALAQHTETPRTPSEEDLDKLGRDVALGALAICSVAFGLGLLRGHGALPMLKSAIALAVAAVPEGLPTVATSTLALGLRRMRRQQLIVRHLAAVETLGSIQVLCLDKTGTLTQNRMKVTAAASAHARWDLDESGTDLPPSSEAGLRIAEIAILALENDGGDGTARVDSGTERALLEFARATGVDLAALTRRYSRQECRLRDQVHNVVAVRHLDHEGGELLAVKGRPGEVLARCDRILVDGAPAPLSEALRRAVSLDNERLAARGLRVLGMAYRTDARRISLDDEGLVWSGLVGMRDPVREGVAGTIARLQRAGIRTVMITGDQGGTAVQVAEALNLSAGEPLRVLDAEELESIEPAMLAALAAQAHVFARVSPAKKLEIVQALQRAGRVVGMTGDGINDGPALKAANLGIAMGRDGTRVARDVADLLIEDDDLSHVVAGVREGRTILSNIRKAVHFLLSTNLSEIFVVLVEVLRGPQELESPMELFWINLVTDVLPGLGLALEPPEPGVLDKPPRAADEPLIDAAYYKRLALEAGIIGTSALGAHLYGLVRYGPGPQTRGVTFLSMASAQLLHSLSCRSDRFEYGGVRGLFENRTLVGALGASFALQALPFLLPPLRRLLGIAPLTLPDVGVAALAAGGSFAVNELVLALRHGEAMETNP